MNKLVIMLNRNEAFTIATIIGSLLLVIGTLLFVINIFATIKANQTIGTNKDLSL